MRGEVAGTAFGVGDEVIRRREVRGQASPLIGTVRRVLPNGRLRVRWKGALRPFGGGRVDNHSTLSPKALVLATPENVEAAQTRIYRGLRKAHRQMARDHDGYAVLEAGMGESRRADGHRKTAARHRQKVREIEERLGEG